MKRSSAEVLEAIRYNLVTELSGRKEFSGWSMNELDRLARKIMRGVDSILSME